MAEFTFQEMFELGDDPTEYRLLGTGGISTIEIDGREILKVDPEVLTNLAAEAIRDVSHLLRSSHLAQLAKAGVLEAHKHGRTVLYRVRFTDVAGRLRALADAIEACDDGSGVGDGCCDETS